MQSTGNYEVRPEDFSGGIPNAAAWCNRAGELARWVWDRYVNRTDVWGGYNAVADRKKKIVRENGTEYELGPTTTRPWKKKRGRESLTLEHLVRHFQATDPTHVVGLHTTSSENTSKFGSVEIDHHGESSAAPEITWGAAKGWYDRLKAEGFHPLLTDSNGKGGYHLDLLFASPVPTAKVFWFMKQVVRDHAAFDMLKAPETFPKQSAVATPEEIAASSANGRPNKSTYGNWLRLPGLHHTRAHWSRVWSGERWIEGNAAVEFVLSISGDDPALIPDDIELRVRIGEYMGKLPNLGEGQGRDDVAFLFAAFLVRDLALPDDIALHWLAEWDAGNRPPKGNDRLQEIIANAHAYGQRERGSGNAPREDSPGAGPQPETPKRGFRFDAISSRQLQDADLAPRWLVRKILVAGQPCIVGAPKKGMKTSTCIDLAISIATGTPWLDAFDCLEPQRVVVLSGESGAFTIRETARRVCAAKGRALEEVDVQWMFRLPRLSIAAEVAELAKGIKSIGAKVVFVDPLYLCLLAGSEAKASNIYDMGPLLLDIAEACLEAGATPILLHHTSKPSQARYDEPPELEDLAFAGVQEFARQWILLKRRERYEPGSGMHSLWMSVGGSVGHGGLWGLDIDEGIIDDNFSGRRWTVAVRHGGDVRSKVRSADESKRQEQRTAKQQRQQKDNEARFMAAFEKLATQKGADGKPIGWAGFRKVRNLSKLSSQMADRVAAGLVDQGVLEDYEQEVHRPHPKNPQKNTVKRERALRRPLCGMSGMAGTEWLFVPDNLPKD